MDQSQLLDVKVPEGGPSIELEGKEIIEPPVAEPLPSAEELLKQADALGEQLRALIVLSKRLPRSKGLEPHQESSRSLSLAQMYLQTGFMWLRRAIKEPKEF